MKFELHSCVKILENVKPETGDIYETAGILMLELEDMMNASKKRQYASWKKQRKECLKTLKAFKKEIEKLKF